MVRSAGDQLATGPIGVFDQSMERISAPISPPPVRQSSPIFWSSDIVTLSRFEDLPFLDSRTRLSMRQLANYIANLCGSHRANASGFSATLA